MASPFQIATLGSVKGIDYSPQRRNIVLGDNSVLMAIQTGVTVCTLEQTFNPTSAAPTFNALAQTFTVANSTDVVIDMWRAPGTLAGTDDVWVAIGSDAGTATNAVIVAHAVYTYATQGWNWDNTGTTAVTPGTTNSQTVSIVWNGTYLIVCYRDAGWNVSCTYTTTRNGSGGWVAGFALSATGAGSHMNPILLHDAKLAGGLGATICIYTTDSAAGHQDRLTSQLLLDSAASPAFANWKAAVQDATTLQNTGAAQLSATVDPATGQVHVINGTSVATAGVYYNLVTTDSSGVTTWAARVTVDTTAGGLYTVAVCIDVLGRVYAFYSAGTLNTSGTGFYRTADAPYTAFGSAVATVATTAGDGLLHVPSNDVAVAGYIPLLFQRPTTTAQFDNTIAAQSIPGNAKSTWWRALRGSPFVMRAMAPFQSAQRLSYPPAQPGNTPLALAGTMNSFSSFTGTFYVPGLVVSTRTESGITGGPPGNNTTETVITWLDLLGNGWDVCIVPAYGGALISRWDEIDAYVSSISETSLSTSNPDGFIHLLSNIGGTFTGTEDPTFTLTELAPTGQAFRRYYDSGVMSVVSGPALQYRVRTCVYPGDPGHYYHRIDVINPSGSAVPLQGTDGIEIAMLGGLTQASQGGSSAWIPANGVYATVGLAEVAWPGPEPTTTVFDADYVSITPTAGSALKLAAVCVRAKASNGGVSIAALAGASNAQITYLTNTNRLKVKTRVDMSSFPGSTTMTLYYVESRPRNLAAGQAASLAADYLNPDASSIVAVGTPASPFFSLDEGAYVVAAVGNTVKLTHTFPTNVTKRWTLNYKITNYTSTRNPIVTVGGVQIDNLNALTYVDTGNSIAYVVLMPALVSSGAVAPDLNNAQVVIQQPDLLTGSFAGIGGFTGTLSLAVALAGTETAVSTETGTLAIAEALAGTMTSVSTDTGTLAVAEALAGTSTAVSTETGTLALQEALAGTFSGVSTDTGTLAIQTALAGASRAVSSFTGTLSLAVALSGSATGVETETGTLALAEALAGTSSGVSAFSGNLQALTGNQIAGSMAGIGSFTGTLSIQTALAGTSSSSSALTGTLGLAVGLSAAPAAAVSTFAGTLGLGLALAGVATFVGTETGTLTLVSTGGLAGTSRAEGRFSATLILALALNGTMRAQSSFGGSLALGSAVDGQVVASVATASRVVPGAAALSQAGAGVAPVSTVKTTVTVD